MSCTDFGDYTGIRLRMRYFTFPPKLFNKVSEKKTKKYAKTIKYFLDFVF